MSLTYPIWFDLETFDRVVFPFFVGGVTLNETDHTIEGIYIASLNYFINSNSRDEEDRSVVAELFNVLLYGLDQETPNQRTYHDHVDDFLLQGSTVILVEAGYLGLTCPFLTGFDLFTSAGKITDFRDQVGFDSLPYFLGSRSDSGFVRLRQEPFGSRTL
jgi:hypothetical protein